MAKVGIFWVYKSTVIGKRAALRDGHENVPGIIDSPFNHVDCWEHDPSFDNPFPELRGSEYQTIPRGRVLYQTKNESHVIYLARELLGSASQTLIAEFFEFDAANATWEIDLHYTTSPEEIDSFFEDSED